MSGLTLYEQNKYVCHVSCSSCKIKYIVFADWKLYSFEQVVNMFEIAHVMGLNCMYIYYLILALSN